MVAALALMVVATAFALPPATMVDRNRPAEVAIHRPETVPVQESNMAQRLEVRVREMIANNGEKNTLLVRVRERVAAGRKYAEIARKHVLRYREMVSKVHQAVRRFRLKVQEWQKVRKMCQEGNQEACYQYLDATKEMILTAIDTAIDRLEFVAEANIEVNVAEINQAIATLEEYKAQVTEINDINDLREIYPEIREAIRLANKLFNKYYALSTIGVAQGLTFRLEAAVVRLQAILERLKLRGIDVSEAEDTITQVIAKLTALEEELNNAREQLLAGQITPEEFMQQIKEIRAAIWSAYRDVRGVIGKIMGVRR